MDFDLVRQRRDRGRFHRLFRFAGALRGCHSDARCTHCSRHFVDLDHQSARLAQCRLGTFNRSSESLWSVLSTTTALTLWAFLRLESATIPAGDVRDPARNVPLAPVIGASIAIIVTVDARGTPAPGLIFGSVLASALVLANFQKDLVQLFTFSILLSTAATLFPYVVCSAADLHLRDRLDRSTRHHAALLIAAIALVFNLYALFSSGRDALLWGVVLVLAGGPIHWRQREAAKREATAQRV